MRVPLMVLPLAVAGALAGCGAGSGAPPLPVPSGDPAPAPAARTELAARAAAAQDLVGVAIYSLTPAGREDPAADGERTVMVVRAADGSWRVDIPGGALGGTVDVSIVATADGLFHCTPTAPPEGRDGPAPPEGRDGPAPPGRDGPAPPERGGCVPVDELTAEVDPRVHHVFTDWLDVLTDRSAAVAVAHAPSPEGIPAGLDGAGGADGRCFAVQPSSASLLAPLDGGVYCYLPDGTLTGARLDQLGSLTLVSADPTAPPSVDLPGPVVAGGEPLPTASPTPSPAPSPAATPSGSPDEAG